LAGAAPVGVLQKALVIRLLQLTPQI